MFGKVLKNICQKRVFKNIAQLFLELTYKKKLFFMKNITYLYLI